MTIFNAHHYHTRDPWWSSVVETYPSLEWYDVLQVQDMKVILFCGNKSLSQKGKKKIWYITWIASAVLSRKSGEEYLIRSRFKKLSKAARMWLCRGLKDGSANLGLILYKEKGPVFTSRNTKQDVIKGRMVANKTSARVLCSKIVISWAIIIWSYTNSNPNEKNTSLFGSTTQKYKQQRKMKRCERSQWPVLFILLFWRKANTPIVIIVSEVEPEKHEKANITFEGKLKHVTLETEATTSKSNTKGCLLHYITAILRKKKHEYESNCGPVEPITRVVWITIKRFWAKNLITRVEKWYALREHPIPTRAS